MTFTRRVSANVKRKLRAMMQIYVTKVYVELMKGESQECDFATRKLIYSGKRFVRVCPFNLFSAIIYVYIPRSVREASRLSVANGLIL